MPFDIEKLKWLGYPIVKFLKICLFVLTESTNVMDGRTDRRTHRHRMTAKAVLDDSIGCKIYLHCVPKNM